MTDAFAAADLKAARVLLDFGSVPVEMRPYACVDVDCHHHALLTVIGLRAVEPQRAGIIDDDNECRLGGLSTQFVLTITGCR